MSIFTKLSHLYSGVTSEEDFFTEIIVGVLQKHPDLLNSFITLLVGRPVSYYSYRVDSQVGLPKLSSHQMGSRPDVLIQLFDEDASDIILIESKLGSAEGVDQLPRYADHLMESFPNARNRYLVYITQYTDPKDEAQITRHMWEHVQFRPLRWSKFYKLLIPFRQDMLVDEIASYMEEKGMAENYLLSPADVFSFTSFSKTLDFILNSLEGDVSNKFMDVLGVKPYPYREMFGFHLRSWSRLLLYRHIGSDWWFGVGYFFDKQGFDYPSLRLHIEIFAKSPRWHEIASCFKELCSTQPNPGLTWESFSLDRPQSWAGIFIRKPLPEILRHPDHLAAARSVFSNYLDQVNELKKIYPNLPWNSV